MGGLGRDSGRGGGRGTAGWGEEGCSSGLNLRIDMQPEGCLVCSFFFISKKIITARLL